MKKMSIKVELRGRKLWICFYCLFAEWVDDYEERGGGRDWQKVGMNKRAHAHHTLASFERLAVEAKSVLNFLFAPLPPPHRDDGPLFAALFLLCLRRRSAVRRTTKNIYVRIASFPIVFHILIHFVLLFFAAVAAAAAVLALLSLSAVCFYLKFLCFVNRIERRRSERGVKKRSEICIETSTSNTFRPRSFLLLIAHSTAANIGERSGKRRLELEAKLKIVALIHGS